MERKFKIGDKVEVAVGNKGVIVDEIYNQITGRLFSVDCGENGMGLYKASALTLIEEKPERKFKVGDRARTELGNDVIVICDLYFNGHGDNYIVKYDDLSVGPQPESNLTLIPPKKLPEPKFNVYDRVRVDTKGFTTFNAEVTSWVICGDHYIYTLKLDDGSTLQSTGESAELINPRYKPGDLVWSKVEKAKYRFEKPCRNIETCQVSGIIVRYEDIEPYTGQDKVDEEPSKISKPTHPFTVILKSGVKVGISATMFDFINEQPDIIGAVQTVEDGKFFLHQIEAIVPTENLIP